MTEEERKALLLEKAQIQARLAKAEGKPLPKATLKGQDEEIFAPPKTAVSPLSTLLNQSVSGKIAASKNILPTPKAKARPVNAPDTGATSLVTNKIDPKAKPLPSAVKRAQMERGQAAQRSTRSGDVKAYESRTTGKPSAGDVRAYEATQRPARPVESTAEKFAKDLAMYLNPSADTSRTGTLANLLSSGVQTLPGLGGSPESLQRFGKSTEGLAGKIVGENYDPTDPESALLTVLSGVGPAAGGQFAMGAVSKVLPRTLNPLLAGGAKLGSAIAGGAGAGYVQGKGTEAIANAIGQGEAYQQKQQQVADFQSRHALLSTLLQSGGAMAMQRPSLGATMGERGAGLGLGLATSVGGDIVGNQPIDWQKAVNEAIVNAVTAGPNTKLGTAVENAGGKVAAKSVKAVQNAPYRQIPGFDITDTADMNQVMPDSRYVPRTITKQAPPSIEPSKLDVKLVDPNAPVELPTTVKPAVPKTSAQAPSKTKVAVPMGEAGTVAPESLISTTPTTRRGKVTETTPTVETATPSGRTFDDVSAMSIADMSSEINSLVAEQSKRRSQSANLNAGGRDSIDNPFQDRINQLRSEINNRKKSATETLTSLDIASETELRSALDTYTHELNLLQAKGKSGPTVDSLLKKITRIEGVLNSRFPDSVETPPAEPVKQTGDLLTRPAEPVKETPKSIQVEEATPALQAEPKLETAEPTAPKTEPLTPARRTILARDVQSALADVNAPDKATSEAARTRLTTALDTLRADGAIKGEGVKLTDAITDRESFRKSVQEAFNLPDDQADEVANLVDDWAHGWAKKNDATPADFYRTVKGIHSFDDDLAQLVLGTGAKTAKGARLPQEGVITALKRGDVSTAVHEMAHHFLDTLPDTARQKVMDSFPGATKENAHELFAKGFEAGLKDPNSPLHRYYTKFKSWLDDVYGKSIAQWRKATNYVEGGLRVQEDRNGKKIVSFVTGLPEDANDIVMDYINTGRMTKGSALEGEVAPKVETVAPKAETTTPKKDTVKTSEAVNKNTGLTKAQSDYFLRELLKKREELAPNQTPATPGTWEKTGTYGGKKLIKYNRGEFTVSVRQSSKAGTLWQVAPGHDTTWKTPAEGESYVELRTAKAAAERLSLALERGEKGIIPEDFTVEIPGGAKYKVRGTLDAIDAIISNLNAKSSETDLPAHLGISSTTPKQMAADVLRSYGSAEKAASAIADLMTKADYTGTLKAPSRKRLTEVIEELVGRDRAGEYVGQYQGEGAPQFQQADDDTTTIFDVPLKNAAIQGFFNIDEKTLQLKTTVKAEMQSALELAQTPGFAEQVIKQVLNGENVLTPKFTAQNIVVAAEASKRRTAWESLKNSDAPQSEVDKAYNDYMKMVNASYLLGREPGMALRMRQEMVATADPLDPDSYISKAAGMYTGNLNDPEFKAFVERVTAKSATARQSHDSLMSEVDRLSKAYDESQAALAQANTDKATIEAEKKKIEDQLFSKKPSKAPSKPVEGQDTTSGTTAPKTASNLPSKTRKTGYERGTTKLKTESTDEARSASKKKAFDGFERLKELARQNKFQYQQDDETYHEIDESRQALIDIGQGLLASGTHTFKTFREEISGFLGEVGLDDLEFHKYQMLWVDSKLALRDEVPDASAGVNKSSLAGTTIQKVISSLSLEGAKSWLDNISDTDGNPVIFEKLVKGQDLTPAELDVAARAWMVVQKAQGQRVSNRGKVGAIEDIKRVARELKAQDTAPRKDITMDAALESISKMTEGLGKEKSTASNPVMRARLSRFNGAVKSLAKRYIGEGQLTATEFKSLVADATKQFKDAGTDVEKHQQVLRDLRSNTLRGVGLDPNVRYRFSQYKTDTDAMDAVKAKIDNDGQGLAALVSDYASGRKVSQPNPLLDLATVEYAKAGESIIAWSKAVENRWGKTLGDAERKKLYKMAEAQFFAMSDPNDPEGIPYAVQAEQIKQKMNLETERLVFEKKSWLKQTGISLVESATAMIGNVASFDYSFGGHQGGAAFILNPKRFMNSIAFGVKATGIQSLRGGPSLESVALAWDKSLAAEMNDTYGDPEYYKKVNLALGDSAFADTYTSHGFVSEHARDLADFLSSSGVKTGLKARANALEKKGNTAAAEKLRARAEAMRGPGERSEAMNKMFIRNLRKDLFNQFTGNGKKYRALRMELEKAPDDATREMLQKKLYALDQFNKVIGEVVSIVTGHGTTDLPQIRGFLTNIGRYGGIWSPTFMLSRFQGLTAYPTIKFLAHAREHVKQGMTPAQILHAAAIPLAVQQVEIQALNGFLWLMSQLPGVQIMGQSDDEDKRSPWNWLGLDPLNTDYGKIRVGNQEFDVSAGFRKPYIAANRAYELARNGLVNIVRASNKEVDEVLLTPMEKWVNKDAVASMRDFMYTHTAPPLPNKGEYDPYQRRITNPSEGLRFLDQYISSSLTPIAGLGYEVFRRNATDFRRQPITMSDIGWRLLTPIPVSNALHDNPTEKARREKEVKELGISKATELSDAMGKDWFKSQAINSIVDIGGIGSDVRDRKLEEIIDNARKYPSWSKYSDLPPTKKQVELRTKIRQMIRDQQAFAMSKSGVGTFMPDKAVRQSADQMTRDMRIEQLSESDLLKIYRDLKTELRTKRKQTPYMLSPKSTK